MVEAWHDGGLSARDFANTHQISKASLLRWHQRTSTASRVTVSSFVPVHVSHDEARESADTSSTPVPTQAFAHVTLGRLEVRIMPGSAAQDVKLLLGVLAEVRTC